jgi:serine/threonine protein kinase
MSDMKYCPLCHRTYGDTAAVCEVDGARLLQGRGRTDTLIGQVLKGRYRVVRQLGEGGMGTVYLGEQVTIGRKVALKLLHEKYAWDEEFVRRFRQEARLTASLSHPHVITVYDFDQADDGTLFIAMEYIEGSNLRELIQEKPLDVSRAVRLGIQIAEGLAAAHYVNVIHRDVKPENIMVARPTDHVKLTDFGIARLRDAPSSTRLTRAGTIMGTPAYMAPEQIEGEEASQKTDIYALGIILYEMLSGTVPFTAPTPAAVLMKHLREVPIPLGQLRRGIPPAVERIVAQALEKKPEHRPAGMAEIANALRNGELGRISNTFTISATERLEQPQADLSAPRSALKISLLGKLRGKFGAPPKKTTGALTVRETALSRGFDTTSGSDGMAETIAVTQPIEGSQKKTSGWKWAAIGAAIAVFGLAAVFVYLGLQESRVASPPLSEPRQQEAAPIAPRIVALQVAPSKEQLEVNERAAMRLKVEYSDGHREEVSEGVEWMSSDPSVVSVRDGDVLEAKRAGKAEIRARYKGIDAPVTLVTVRPPAAGTAGDVRLLSLQIHSGKKEINVNDRAFLKVSGNYSDGRTSEIKKGVRWESSDSSVLSVDSGGEVQGHREGIVEIIARYQGIRSDPLSVSVRAPKRRQEVEKIKEETPIRKEEPPARKEEPPTREAVVIKEKPAKDLTVKDAATTEAAVKDHLKLARSYRDRGDYSQAVAQLEAARKIDPANKEVTAELTETRRACDAEKLLGRPDLKC